MAEWEEQKEVVHQEGMTSREATRDRVVDELRERLAPHADREKLGNGTYTAWYDPGNQMDDPKVPPDSEVVWVRLRAVQEILDDLGKDGSISTLSASLREGEVTYAGSRRKSEGRLWPFIPERVGVEDPDLDVHHDDDDTEVEP